MKAYPSLLSLAVIAMHSVATLPAQSQDGDIFSDAQAVEENISDAPSPSRPKGALEQGGQPLGKTAPLNADRATGPTAEKQSSRPESVQITRAIRQQIIERKDLSTAAKNVKVITDDQGSVTLRGPVKTASERQEINASWRWSWWRSAHCWPWFCSWLRPHRKPA